MRLIDIDKHFELNEPFYRADIEMPLHRVKEALESLPTVQAITIDWIRDYMLRLSDGSEAYECILVMLEEWEKENETNRR